MRGFLGKFYSTGANIKGNKIYKAVDDEILDEYVVMQQELQMAIDQSEEKEKVRLSKFFSALIVLSNIITPRRTGQSCCFWK